MIKDENTPDIEQDENEIDETESTEETTEETTEAETEETTTDDVDWKSEALKYKAILERNKNKPSESKKSKSDDFGYDVKAYLKASGIKSTEFDFVKNEVKASGMDIDSLLDNDYFQSKLEKHRALQKTSDATIKGTRSGATATDSVEYWLSKPIEEVPAEMRSKVVNAKLAKEKNKGMFYNS